MFLPSSLIESLQASLNLSQSVLLKKKLKKEFKLWLLCVKNGKEESILFNCCTDIRSLESPSLKWKKMSHKKTLKTCGKTSKSACLWWSWVWWNNRPRGQWLLLINFCMAIIKTLIRCLICTQLMKMLMRSLLKISKKYRTSFCKKLWKNFLWKKQTKLRKTLLKYTILCACVFSANVS